MIIGGWFGKKKRQKDFREEENSVSGASSAQLPFRTDLHSHLIPHIDDGAQSLKESLDLLQRLENIGYRRCIITPHVMADSYRNSTERILTELDKLRKYAETFGIKIELHAAAEYYLDEELLHRLKIGDILSVGSGYLLFETSYYASPLNLEEAIYEIAASGYRPLLAHPERYRYVQDPEEFYGRLREQGVSFQVNINSFGGHYGSDAYRKARWLSEKGWIDFLGSDLHHRPQADFLHDIINSDVLDSVMKYNVILNDQLELSKG